MRTAMTDGGPGTDFWEVFETFRRSAWRFEQQPAYALGYEQEQFDLFLAGKPESPLENAELGSWMRQVAFHKAAGKSIGRVRIVEDPPTDYQRWMRWMDAWNREFGEDIRYLARGRATEAGLLELAGDTDWWLFDDERLVLMHFDQAGVRVGVELTTDEVDLRWARQVRSLALQIATVPDSGPVE